MEYTIRKAKKRGETYPRGVLVPLCSNLWQMETVQIIETFGNRPQFAVRFGWTTFATFDTLDEAARWAMRALDRHFNRSEA